MLKPIKCVSPQERQILVSKILQIQTGDFRVEDIGPVEEEEVGAAMGCQ